MYRKNGSNSREASGSCKLFVCTFIYLNGMLKHVSILMEEPVIKEKL